MVVNLYAHLEGKKNYFGLILKELFSLVTDILIRAPDALPPLFTPQKENFSTVNEATSIDKVPNVRT